MSSSSGIGSTLTGGIQDIAGILPLLGTEQCSIHVSSALTRGYFYAASAPMSIFGSLGVVNAGFKTLLACFSLGDIEGAEILENIGFEPQGENLSLIMLDGGKGEKKRYLIENRIDELIEDLNIDKTRITEIFRKSAVWNFWMFFWTAVLCAVSITPYIYVNRGDNSLDLKGDAIWVFPILRSAGGFLTATLIQILIQQRITLISREYLVKRNQQPVGIGAVEAAAPFEKNYHTDILTGSLLFLLLLGLLASVVGYVGCFSIVQNSASASGPLSWLCLEAGLSLFRLFIWARNPKCDDAPPLEIRFELDKHNPLPTCNKDSVEIFLSKVLPLTRARDFLKSITSFVGLIEPFRNPDLSLYYTLTRKRAYKEDVSENGKNRDNEPWDAKSHEPGERTLYITVFDHKERTTRIYTRDDKGDAFYSTKSDAPHVDVGHHLLEVEIDTKIVDIEGDPVCSDSKIQDSLREHHRSILEKIRYRLGAANVTRPYAIKNPWTMKVENTPERLSEAVDKEGRDSEKERTDKSLASDYFMYSSIERQRRLLDEGRGKWIARRMEMITKETKERLLGMGVEYRGNTLGTKSPEEVNEMVDKERCVMELLLIYEVREWERRFWKKFEAFRDQIDGDRKEEKRRLTREWRANCWKRLDIQKHAALKRIADLDITDKDHLLEEWESSIRLLSEGVENPNPISLCNLRREIGDGDGDGEREMHLRMENEMEDIEFRLKRGSDSGRFDQFWDDDLLFNCRYSRSKWLYFWQDSTVPLEVYLHALKGNKNITHISFDGMEPDFDVNHFLRDLPWVTSGPVYTRRRP